MALYRKLIISAIFLILTFLMVFHPKLLFADQITDLRNKIEEYENKIKDLQGQQRTLASTISYLDNQIQLTTNQIDLTEQQLRVLADEIANLSVKIDVLDKSITEVSTILDSRILATYKRSTVKPIYLFFSSQNFSSFLSRMEYLKVAKKNDHKLLVNMNTSKLTYDNQKQLKQQKQAEEEKLKKQLVIQQSALAQQKKAKQNLLVTTKNDESRFQQLLAAARAEMEAIQSIIAGNGQETKVGDVKEGDTIASIISGASACSTGTHLHFEIVTGGAHTNPVSFLKSKDVDWNTCGWYGCDSSFEFRGSWNWPLNDRVTITQGYGMTAYAKSGAYGGGPHTGIDMDSSDHSVKAVKNGLLYRGSIACGGGTLRYVKMEHKEDSNIDTYYLHVNYY